MHRLIAIFLLLITISWAEDPGVPVAGFPKVKLLGNLQPDRGWVLKGLEVEGKAFQDHAKGAQAALRSQGWDRANATQRRKLALDWCTQAELFGHSVLRQKPEDFPGAQKFTPPTTSLTKNGAVRVEVWWASLSGNVLLPAGSYYHLSRWEILKDAQVRESR